LLWLCKFVVDCCGFVVHKSTTIHNKSKQAEVELQSLSQDSLQQLHNPLTTASLTHQRTHAENVPLSTYNMQQTEI